MSEKKQFVICSRCGAKVFISSMEVSCPGSFGALVDVFERSFVCYSCLRKKELMK